MKLIAKLDATANTLVISGLTVEVSTDAYPMIWVEEIKITYL